jgi:DNA-binding transcriptional LysR family regulator
LPSFSSTNTYQLLTADYHYLPSSGGALELRQLRYFAETASRLSFRQAAERLYVTQPAISRQISELERELGVSLFVRDKRHVALTYAGEMLLVRARQILALADETDRNALTRETRERAAMTVGVSRMVGPQITDVLRLFCDQHRDVRLELREGDTTEQLATLMNDGGIDAAFGQPVDFERHGLETTLLQRYEMFALVHPSHPLAARASITIKSLASESILAHPALWPTVKPYVQEAGFRPHLLRDAVPSAGGPAMSMLLYMKYAVAFWVPGLIPAPHGASLVRLEPTPQFSYGLGWRKGHNSPAVKALVALINELRGRQAVLDGDASIAS